MGCRCCLHKDWGETYCFGMIWFGAEECGCTWGGYNEAMRVYCYRRRGFGCMVRSGRGGWRDATPLIALFCHKEYLVVSIVLLFLGLLIIVHAVIFNSLSDAEAILVVKW
jgi:hypothetical protein